MPTYYPFRDIVIEPSGIIRDDGDTGQYRLTLSRKANGVQIVTENNFSNTLMSTLTKSLEPWFPALLDSRKVGLGDYALNSAHLLSCVLLQFSRFEPTDEAIRAQANARRMNHFISRNMNSEEVEFWGEEAFSEFGFSIAATITVLGDQLKNIPFWGVARGGTVSAIWGGSYSGLKSVSAENPAYINSAHDLYARISQISLFAVSSEYVPNHLCELVGSLTMGLSSLFMETSILKRLGIPSYSSVNRHGMIHIGKDYHSRYSALCLGWITLALYVLFYELSIDVDNIAETSNRLPKLGAYGGFR